MNDYVTTTDAISLDTQVVRQRPAEWWSQLFFVCLGFFLPKRKLNQWVYSSYWGITFLSIFGQLYAQILCIMWIWRMIMHLGLGVADTVGIWGYLGCYCSPKHSISTVRVVCEFLALSWNKWKSSRLCLVWFSIHSEGWQNVQYSWPTLAVDWKPDKT